MVHLEQKHINFLDSLRETGVTNMFGAVPYVQKSFPDLSKNEARSILLQWMDYKQEEEEKSENKLDS